MIDSFAFSEVVRKLANLIRIGKIAEIDGANVKVKIGKVITGWLPIVSTAGETVIWNPISKDEQVIVFAPYGEFAQGFVLRSIHYNSYKKPEKLEEISLNTPNFIKINSKNGLNGEFEEDFSIKVGSATINLTKKTITIQNGDTAISLSNDGITLNAGGGSISLSKDGINLSSGGGSLRIGDSISIDGNSVSLSGNGASIDLSGSVSISGSSISTNPPVCKCQGGL